MPGAPCSTSRASGGKLDGRFIGAPLPQREQAALQAIPEGGTRRCRRLAMERGPGGIVLHGHGGQMPESGLTRSRIDEDGPAPGIVRERVDHPGAERVEHRLAGVQPDARLPRVGTTNSEPLPHRGRIAPQRRQERIEGARVAGLRENTPSRSP